MLDPNLLRNLTVLTHDLQEEEGAGEHADSTASVAPKSPVVVASLDDLESAELELSPKLLNFLTEPNELDESGGPNSDDSARETDTGEHDEQQKATSFKELWGGSVDGAILDIANQRADELFPILFQANSRIREIRMMLETDECAIEGGGDHDIDAPWSARTKQQEQAGGPNRGRKNNGRTATVGATRTQSLGVVSKDHDDKMKKSAGVAAAKTGNKGSASTTTFMFQHLKTPTAAASSFKSVAKNVATSRLGAHFAKPMQRKNLLVAPIVPTPALGDAADAADKVVTLAGPGGGPHFVEIKEPDRRRQKNTRNNRKSSNASTISTRAGTLSRLGSKSLDGSTRASTKEIPADISPEKFAENSQRLTELLQNAEEFLLN